MKLGADAPVHQRDFSRRRFLAGTAGVGVLLTVGSFAADSLLAEPWAYADGPTVGLPTSGTAPEQVHLTWGSDPGTQVTVSWASPGTAAMPAASLLLDTAPITAASTSKTVQAVSYTDGLNLETVHCYHAAVTGLTPSTQYHYRISDGASPATTVDGTFTTAPSGRVAYTFSSVGDLATPSKTYNVSGTTWSESSDNAHFLPLAVESSAPLFHLLNGDLCYANLNTNNQPEVWRDFGRNNQVSAMNRPWMPCLGNHEIEFGVDNQDGTASSSGAGNWNGAYGYLSYQTRYLLPDNGVAGLRGNFYAFQVGTVLFISLDADDVAFQDGGSYYAPKGTMTSSGTYTYAPLTATNPAISIAPGTSLYNHAYTGGLTAGANDSIVPDTSAATPNQQTTWLAQTLKAARANSSIDMIVVQMHQCALSSSLGGNGSDLGIRKTWLPLFDQYSVDIVVNGHDHDYERSFAVRGYDASYQGTVAAPNPGQAAAGSSVDTRRPTTITAAGPIPTTVNGTSYANGFDTSQGTVFLTLGGGGTDGPTDTYGTDAATGLPQAKVITTRNLIYTKNGAYTRNGADSLEDAPWSALRDTTDAYGYATFAVDPGAGPGGTTITMTYYHAPQVSGGDTGFQGTTSYSPYDVVVFGRGLVGSAPAPALPEFGMPALAAGAALAIGGAAVVARRRALSAE